MNPSVFSVRKSENFGMRHIGTVKKLNFSNVSMPPHKAVMEDSQFEGEKTDMPKLSPLKGAQEGPCPV